MNQIFPGNYDSENEVWNSNYAWGALNVYLELVSPSRVIRLELRECLGPL